MHINREVNRLIRSMYSTAAITVFTAAAVIGVQAQSSIAAPAATLNYQALNFRASLAAGQIRWRPIHEVYDEQGDLIDRYSVSESPALSAEGYRLVWYHSERKAEGDAAYRARQVDRALRELAELQEKLSGPRSRYHDQGQVTEAVEAILEARGVKGWITTTIVERESETYRQERRGRPSSKRPPRSGGLRGSPT